MISNNLYPTTATLDKLGNLYFAISGQNGAVYGQDIIYKVDSITKNISRYAGDGTRGASGDNGLAINAQLNTPACLVVDEDNNLIFSDVGNSVVRTIDSNTGIISILAGNYTAGFSGDGGLATNASLHRGNALGIDEKGDVYISDNYNNIIRKIDKNTGIISTIAGNRIGGNIGDGGMATDAQIYPAAGIAFDGIGNLYFTEYITNVIKKIDTNGMLSTFAGIVSATAPYGTFGGDGGPAINANLNMPSNIYFDSVGNLLIADTANMRIRKIDMGSKTISTIAGSGVYGSAEGNGGPATLANLVYLNIAIDNLDNIYVIASFNNTIRRIDHSTGIIDLYLNLNL